MNHRYRELAPISPSAWEAIDDEARKAIEHFIAGRHLFPLDGPHSYAMTAVPSGRLAKAEDVDGVSARVLLVHPLVELRVEFSLSREDLEALDRGADVALDAVVAAARAIAAAEDHLVFAGLESAGIDGSAAASPHDTVALGSGTQGFPQAVASAVTELRSRGVGGPYGMAVGPQEHRVVLESTEEGGFPVLQHLQLILEGGPVVWAPTLDGALVVSQRGGDFQIVSGLDFSIRYRAHDHERVQLEIVETVTFRNLSPDAAVRIR
jgi:uncharacterized linocin/CFP29 family protein